ERARDVITNGWDDIVGVKVRCLPADGYLGPVSFNSSMASGANGS
ncbi:ABC transporter substrate-binding protein, partial [Mesorhizobium sp. M4A.F.Ca.ET.090.04.2.1]